jgi:hypothetical protein
VHKRQASEKFGPSANYDDFRRRMRFLDYLQKGSKNHVFAQASLALRDDVLWIRHLV